MKPSSITEPVYTITIPTFPGQAEHHLPIREIQTAKGPVKIALLNLLGNTHLTNQAARALFKQIPAEVDLLITPDGKALGLFHALLTLLGGNVPGVVARKERRSYMREPIFSSVEAAPSMTTATRHHFYIDADDIERIKRAKCIGFVDDVVSRADTLIAIERLIHQCDNSIQTIMAVATEGATPYPGVIALTHLPLF